MMRHGLWLLFAFFGFASIARATVCTPSFLTEENKKFGWLGADAAYSIPLKDGRDIWIFGDTLYGEKRMVRGNDPQMVRNSLGISKCDGEGNWHLQYVIKRDAAGNPQSYFSPANQRHWYWAMDGFEHRGDLWVTLLCLEATKDAMGFRTCGSDLAHVSHLERDPQQWEVNVQTLVPDGVDSYPSASAVVNGEFVYLFAVYESGARPLLATRIPLTGLGDAAKHLEYLAKDGSWKPGLVPADAKEVMAQGTTELSIRYHPERKEWLAVMFDPNGFSDKIISRTSQELTGPWTVGHVVYRVPEMAPGPAHDKNTFCYAAKEHPELEQRNQLLFTYVCNTMNIPSLATNNKIYIPQAVSIPLTR
jgi:Domain of unknown function (DUF4185)